MEELQKLKDLYAAGFLTKTEFDERRISLIDNMTNTQPVGVREADPVDANEHLKQLQNAPVNFTESGSVSNLPADERPIDEKKEPVKLSEEKLKLSMELFSAAQVNDVVRIKSLLDKGADPNVQDYETGNTPAHAASQRGQKHAVYFLVENGAKVNIQNRKGEIPLHDAVKLKFNETVLWLVKRGADIYLKDYKGNSPYSIALPWLQHEMKDESDNYLKQLKIKKEKEAAKRAAVIDGQSDPLAAKLQGTTLKDEVPITQEVWKVFLKNGSYKSIVVNSNTTAKDLADLMAEKLNMVKYAQNLEVIEHQKATEVRLEPNVNVFNIKTRWPHVIKGGDLEHAKYIVVPKRGTSDSFTLMYRDAIYGGTTSK